MKAVISSTYDSNYLFFLPIVTWCWNRLGVDVICFMPYGHTDGDEYRGNMVADTCKKNKLNVVRKYFDAPKHKEATYAQCSRLYAACLDLPEDEILVTSDVDMALFKLPVCYPMDGYFTVFGSDLVPKNQFPICYISASVKDWRRAFNLYYGSCAMNPPDSTIEIKIKTHQEKLDELLGGIEAEHFRGNYWGKDQEEAYNKIFLTQGIFYEPRARPGTQFASHRVDRDDINWRHYVDDSLVDAHLWRPGYEENNFKNIMELLQMKYPNDDLSWIIEYREQYLKLL